MRHQFVFVNRCGCPIGLVEGSYGKTEAGAWEVFTRGSRDERELRERGVHVVHVGHDEYVRTWYPRMLMRCPHVEVAACA